METITPKVLSRVFYVDPKSVLGALVKSSIDLKYDELTAAHAVLVREFRKAARLIRPLWRYPFCPE